MEWTNLSKYWHNAVIFSLFFGIVLKSCIGLNYQRSFITTKLDIIILLFMLHGLLLTSITTFKYNLFSGLNGFRLFFFSGIVYYVFRQYVKTKEDLRRTTLLLIWSTLIISIEVILEFVMINIFSLPLGIFPWFVTGPSSIANIGRLITHTKDYMSMGLYRPIGMLMHIHYTAYVIASGCLIVFPFAFSLKTGLRKTSLYKVMFYIMAIALVFSATRSVNLIVIVLIMFGMYKEHTNNKSLLYYQVGKVAFIVLAIGIGASAIFTSNISKFYLNIFSGEEQFYQAFGVSNVDILDEISKVNPLDIMLGRGFPPGMFEKSTYGTTEQRGKGFKFTHISSELHFFHFLNRVGIIGGALFILQTILAYKCGFRTLRIVDGLYYHHIIMGLSLCPLLFLFSYIHILHGDIVMQFVSYAILGTVGSVEEVFKRTPRIRVTGPRGERVA